MAVEVAREDWTNCAEEFIADVKEGCVFWGVRPFVEVRKVGSWFNLCHVHFYLVDCVGSIDEKMDSLFAEELLKGFNGADDRWD